MSNVEQSVELIVMRSGPSVPQSGAASKGPSWEHLAQVADSAQAKRELLHELLRGLAGTAGLLVAYSGGVDSTYLLYEAHQVLGDRCIGAIAVSESLPVDELDRATALTRSFGIRLETIQTHELDNPDYVRNGPDRCYFCKKELFRHLEPLARSLQVAGIAYGAIADDLGDHRPGGLAASEFRVHAPLQEVSLGKDEIRWLSRAANLPTWHLPAQACLSSRFAYGQPIQPEWLRSIEKAERFIHSLGIREVRVRHHGKTARIEVGADDIAFLASPGVRCRVVEQLREAGYVYVALDLVGYRSGSLNLALPKSDANLRKA